MKSQVRGGTRWKRFAVVMVPSLAATAAIGVGLAQGALAASFAISGQEFKVSTDKLEGTEFVQYGSVNKGQDLEGKPFAAPVAVSGFDTAKITNMCQSVVTPVPGLGPITLRLEAGKAAAKSGEDKDKVQAEELYLDVSYLEADAAFEKIDIGIAAGALNHDAQGKPSGRQGIQPNTQANPHGFGQRAERVTLTDVKQKAWATTAGTFRLPDLSLSLHRGTEKECFQG
ncbi:DUF6230 family protein [Streptomyces sp. NPDC056503]|uniref:DUF6230 family protein n=1 Tax=Streptomyces sp. NPDC056503 TaxID=3345842 RepID=UPI0036ACDEFB